jgi:prepilin-type processing-associated H-X9-DG protein
MGARNIRLPIVGIGIATGLAVMVVVLNPVYSTHGPLPTPCLANLNRQAAAMMIYGSDFDQRWPRAHAWMDSLLPYVPNQSIFHCPSVAPEAYGYAYDAGSAGRRQPSIPDAATTPLLFDSTRMKRSAVATLKTLPLPVRHERGNSIAFADGHVKAVRH